MELYNALIEHTNELLAKGSPKVWPYKAGKAWPDLGSAELVLQSDAAYELGALGLGSANYICTTTSSELVNRDEVVLYGPDLKAIKKDVPFARIVLLRVGVLDGEDEEVYRALKDIEFCKYHVYPEGYMVRMSPESHREQVRVSKKAIKRGINFEQVGYRYIEAYKKDANVLNVRHRSLARFQGNARKRKESRCHHQYADPYHGGAANRLHSMPAQGYL